MFSTVDGKPQLSLGGMKDGDAQLRSDQEHHKASLAMLRVCGRHL